MGAGVNKNRKNIMPSFDLPEIKLPFWMDGGELKKLASAAQEWFKLLGKSALWRVEEQDPLTCTSQMLDLLAWERGITRYQGEADRLYRLRVKYVYANGKDAGLISGWRRIFKRLELLSDEKDLELLERMHGQDWDIIGIGLSDTDIVRLQDVIEKIIIPEYGRTCRRYRFISRMHQKINIGMNIFNDDQNTVMASQSYSMAFTTASQITNFENDHSTMEILWQ